MVGEIYQKQVTYNIRRFGEHSLRCTVVRVPSPHDSVNRR